MRTNIIKTLCGGLLLLCGLAARAQGLQGVLVEEYHTITQDDADYYNNIGNSSFTLEAGMKCYRVYIDMAPGYRLNTVYGNATNPLDFTTTTAFFNDDDVGGSTPPQARRLTVNGGLAFDTWITFSRAAAGGGGAPNCSGGGGGTGSNAEQLGVPRNLDPNGNLTLCNAWSGFGSNDGHVPGSAPGFNNVGFDPDLEAALTTDGNVLTTTGAWALLPAVDGPDVNGANHVLIGQFTTDGDFSFHINVSLAPPGGGDVEFYTHDVPQSGSTVSGFLTYPLANDCAGTPGGSALPGTPCSDGNPCTVGDLWDSNCDCIPGPVADADFDGTCDANDGCPNDPNKTAPGACGCGTADVPTTWYADTDGDGFGDPGNSQPGFTCDPPPGHVANSTDLCPTDPNKMAPGACGCGTADTDTDSDGTADCNDGCPNDPLKTSPGACGCGTADTDSDSDGTPNCNDGCPNDPNKTAPGACGCGTADTDSDSDGTPNCNDGCPNDPNKVAAGTCGCGNPEPGTACNDGDAGTENDVIQGNCTCAGTPIGANDCLGNPGGPAQPGTPCNDANACTINDVYQLDCTCAGTFQDTDGDGTCNANDGCPNDPNKVAPGTCGCGNPEPGTACNDGNPNTTGDIIQGNCTCAGTLANDCAGVPGGTAFIDGCGDCVGGTTGLTPCPQTCTTDLFFVHDAVTDFQQVSWAVYDANTHLEVASGGIGSNNPGSVPLCLPDGCFYLEVTDSNNDGIGGGYRLVTAGDFRRVIDNTGNFLSGGLSAIDNNEGFCLPLGTDQLIYTSCDKLWWRSGDHIVANENPAVSNAWNTTVVGDPLRANSGYEFWFYDPNGGYTFRKLRMHNQGEGYANIGATRACHQKLDNWAAANHLPSGRLLNVKVRGMVHGVPAGNWGPACRFAVDAALAACPPTKLMDIPGDAEYSCGVTRTLARGQRIVARPVRGGKAYQWRFRSLEAPLAPPLLAVTTTYILNLSTVPGLVANGAQYNVEVRASMAGTGGPWCGTADSWGDVCLLTIVNPMIGDNEQSTLHTEDGEALMRVWPNPNRGDRLQLAIDALDEGVEEVVMDLYDLSGKRVLSRVIAGQGGPFSATIDLDGSVAGGIYAVHVTAGDRTWTKRLVLCSP